MTRSNGWRYRGPAQMLVIAGFVCAAGALARSGPPDGAAVSQDQPGDTYVSPSGSRLQMLLDERTLGGKEVEVGEIAQQCHHDANESVQEKERRPLAVNAVRFIHTAELSAPGVVDSMRTETRAGSATSNPAFSARASFGSARSSRSEWILEG